MRNYFVKFVDRSERKIIGTRLTMFGMASYSEPGSNKINIYLPKFNANDSGYFKYGFGRVKLG
jgi:hypothetical protein